MILTDGQLRYLLTDRLYVNITTQKYKLGEIRGDHYGHPMTGANTGATSRIPRPALRKG